MRRLTALTHAPLKCSQSYLFAIREWEVAVNGKESALRACRRGPVHLFMGTAVRADRRAAALNLTD
jgi:hypothetical protein